jgi:hypothetical protein
MEVELPARSWAIDTETYRNQENVVLNAGGRFLLAAPHQSNPAYLQRSHVHWCIPAPPIHGRRSLKRFK